MSYTDMVADFQNQKSQQEEFFVQ